MNNQIRKRELPPRITPIYNSVDDGIGGFLIVLIIFVLVWALSGCARVGVEDSTHEVKVSGGTENIARLEIGSCDTFATNMDEYLYCVGEIYKHNTALDNLDELFKKVGKQQEGEGQ